jgi:hypothetical protein
MTNFHMQGTFLMPMHLLKMPLHVLNHYFLATEGEEGIRDVFAVEKTKMRGPPRCCTERERSSHCGDQTSLPGWNLRTYWEEGKKNNHRIQSAMAIGEIDVRTRMMLNTQVRTRKGFVSPLCPLMSQPDPIYRPRVHTRGT